MYTFWVKKVQFEKVIAKVTQELDKPEKWNESGWVSLRISVQMSMLFTCAREKKNQKSTNKQQPKAAAHKGLAEHHREGTTLFGDIHEFQTTENPCMQRIAFKHWK